MNQRVRSPRYPGISIIEAEDLVKKLYNGDGMHTIDREVAVGHMGYKSLNGASAQALGSLAQYGLIETAGKGQIRLTSLALDILEPQSEEDRAIALSLAAFTPKLFAELRERFPNSTPSEANLRAHLIRQQFQQSALKAVIPAYLQTCEYLSRQSVYDSHGPSPSDDTASHAPSQSTEVHPMEIQAQTRVGSPILTQQPEPGSGVRREVFGLEEGEVVITLPTRLSAESVDDFEAWLNIVARKIRRMAGAPVAPHQASQPIKNVDDEGN